MSSYFSPTRAVPAAFLSDKFASTSRDDVRLSRALAVIHALECLVRSDKISVLKDLVETDLRKPVSREIKAALGPVMMEAFCTGPSRRKVNNGVILGGVRGLIDDVVKHDNAKAEHGGYFITADRYQAEFVKVARQNSKVVSKVMSGLTDFKTIAPQDFAMLRQSMVFNTDDLSIEAQGILVHRNLMQPHGMIDVAEELLIMGFDPDTFEPRV